jgi:putative ABC transport system permease protein
MALLDRLAGGLRALVSRRPVEQDLDEELRAYLAETIEARVARGEDRESAGCAARAAMGSTETVKDYVRDAGWESSVESAWQDVCYAVRTMRRSPGFTAVAVLTLSLAIGVGTTAFTFVDAVLLRPLGFAEPERLVAIRPSSGARLSPAYLHDWREASDTLVDMMGWEDARVTLTGAGEPREVLADRATTNFFDVLGTPALLGRTFTTEQTLSRAEREVVLGHGFWQRHYGGRSDVIGERLVLDGAGFVVAGVMAEAFAIRTNELPESRAELWVPFPLEPGERRGMGGALNVVGRLADGVEPAQAEAELAVIARRIEAQFPSYSRDWGIRAVPLHEATVGDVRLRLLVIAGAVAVLLLVACANVGSLVASRGLTRRTELALRLSLGATPGRLRRQLITESLVLAVVGGLLGLLVAMSLTDVLRSVLPAALGLPRSREVGLDLRVLVFGLGVTGLTTVLVGMVPAIKAARAAPSAALKVGRGALSSAGDTRSAGVIVVAQVAAAVLLVAGAGLVVRSFQALAQVDPGFRAEQALTLRTSLSLDRYDEPARVRAFGADLERRVSAVPGVQAVGWANYLPLTRTGGGGPFEIEGRPTPDPAERPGSFRSVVGGRYFEAMGIALHRGRLFSEADTEDSLPVVVIDEQLARRHWPGGDPVGARVTWGEPDGGTTTGEVVGVVASVRYGGLATEPNAVMYFWFPQRPDREITLVARTHGDPAALANAVAAEVNAIDPNQPIADVRPLDAIVAGDLSQPRVTALLIGGFAAMAMLLAAVGLYAVIAAGVARRTREIGVRMALGAAGRDVVRLVVQRGMRLTVIGLAVGTIATLALGRVFGSLLYGVTPADPQAHVASALVLAVVALLATAIPAWRAVRVDPMIALRSE